MTIEAHCLACGDLLIVRDLEQIAAPCWRCGAERHQHHPGYVRLYRQSDRAAGALLEGPQ